MVDKEDFWHDDEREISSLGQNFLGEEGKELLAALDDVQTSAHQRMPIPAWAKEILENEDKKGTKSDFKAGLNSNGFKFRPYLMPLDEDLELKLRRWSDKRRQKVLYVSPLI